MKYISLPCYGKGTQTGQKPRKSHPAIDYDAADGVDYECNDGAAVSCISTQCCKMICSGKFGMEFNDVYDQARCLTGRVHRRGTRWKPGEYGLVVCVWVYDGFGNILLTRRAPGKSFAGTWENSGGAVKAGEDSLTAIARELFEETGIQADREEFEYLGSDRDRNTHYDFYCLRRNTPLEKIVLLPGETDDARWVSFEQVHQMIRSGEICKIIARQYCRQEEQLLKRQNPQV